MAVQAIQQSGVLSTLISLLSDTNLPACQSAAAHVLFRMAASPASDREREAVGQSIANAGPWPPWLQYLSRRMSTTYLWCMLSGHTPAIQSCCCQICMPLQAACPTGHSSSSASLG